MTLPPLRKRGPSHFPVVMNRQALSCDKLAKMLDLSDDLEILVEPTGEAGRKYGVNRGFCPHDDGLSLLLKCTVMGLGVGPPWTTLPAVLPGYFGNGF